MINVQVCPLSITNETFPGVKNCEEVQEQYFLGELPARGGWYHPRKKWLKLEYGKIVLFQCQGSIIASARLIDRAQDPPIGGPATRWGLRFDQIRVFNPIHKDQMQRLWPSFRADRTTMYLDPPAELDKFNQLLTNVRTPQLQVADAEGDVDEEDQYSPDGVDRRPLVNRQIRARRGSQAFRKSLCQRYGNCCMITGCEVLAVLEAAHISPYRGERDDDPSNGLLLRSDIHTLFDLDRLAIDPQTLRVVLHPAIAETPEYKRYQGSEINCSPASRPSQIALQQRWEKFALERGVPATTRET